MSNSIRRLPFGEDFEWLHAVHKAGICYLSLLLDVLGVIGADSEDLYVFSFKQQDQMSQLLWAQHLLDLCLQLPE